MASPLSTTAFSLALLTVITSACASGTDKRSQAEATRAPKLSAVASFQIRSKILDDERTIHVMSSPDVFLNDETQFFIAQDGRLFFDETTTYQGQSLELSAILKELSTLSKTANLAVVAVNSANQSGQGFLDNTKRYAEYFPKNAIDFIDNPFERLGYRLIVDRKKNNYSRFVVEELIPTLESEFQIDLNQSNLGIVGMSMGGLIGLSLMLEHPDIFGSSIGLSTHWTGINFADYLLLPIRGYIGPSDSTAQALIAYFEQFKSQMSRKTVYVDYGDLGLDAYYEPYVMRLKKILETDDSRLCVLKFENEGHEPQYWRKRLASALSWAQHGDIRCSGIFLGNGESFSSTSSNVSGR